jgi:hypothetical protein
MFTISQTGDTVHILFSEEKGLESIPQIREELDAVVGYKELRKMKIVADVSCNHPSKEDMDYIISDLVPSLKEMGANDVSII